MPISLVLAWALAMLSLARWSAEVRTRQGLATVVGVDPGRARTAPGSPEEVTGDGRLGGTAPGLGLVALLRRRITPLRADLSPRLREQLGQAASAMAAAVRAGRTLTQALGDARREIGPPLGPVLETVLDRLAVGVTFEAAAEAIRNEVRGAEGELFLAVLSIGRRAGVGLPALLDELAASLRERADADREVRALTAQARLSGKILALLPVGFLGLLLLTSRRDVLPVLGTGPGLAMLIAGLILEVLGAAWIRRIVRVEP